MVHGPIRVLITVWLTTGINNWKLFVKLRAILILKHLPKIGTDEAVDGMDPTSTRSNMVKLPNILMAVRRQEDKISAIIDCLEVIY